MSQPQPFQIGLCLAGAVSAGAYTAGVIDFLIEALDTWESQRGQPGVPNHRVEIPVIGGASAGGMTGIIAASALNNSITPVRTANQANLFQPRPENKLYHAWVDLVHDDMFPLMLNTSDIRTNHILSLLNAYFIDQVATRTILADSQNWIKRAYVVDQLKVFTTLSTLRGYWFDIFFRGPNGQKNSYFITRHNDYATFQLNTDNYGNDGWIPLNFRTGLNVNIAKDAAMATGAFPLGLRARTLTRDATYLNDNPWLRETTERNPLPPGPYQNLNVDGGMINNEPFEKVREVLANITGQRDPAAYNNYSRFTSTILMVDPFPSQLDMVNPSDQLFSVIGSTLSALINQARIKPGALADAIHSDKAGQYIIAPTRKVPQLNGDPDKEEIGAPAIACGAFGGFGGFFHKEFRIHDFFLGRANCEKFLRDHFTVPAHIQNLVTAGYAHLSAEQRQRFISQTDNQPGLPIIPVLTQRQPHRYLPTFASGTNWPVRPDKDIERFRKPLKKRADALLMHLDDYKWHTQALLKIGSWVVLKHKLAGKALDLMKEALRKHQLLR